MSFPSIASGTPAYDTPPNRQSPDNQTRRVPTGQRTTTVTRSFNVARTVQGPIRGLQQ